MCLGSLIIVLAVVVVVVVIVVVIVSALNVHGVYIRFVTI